MERIRRGWPHPLANLQDIENNYRSQGKDFLDLLEERLKRLRGYVRPHQPKKPRLSPDPRFFGQPRRALSKYPVEQQILALFTNRRTMANLLGITPRKAHYLVYKSKAIWKGRIVELREVIEKIRAKENPNPFEAAILKHLQDYKKLRTHHGHVENEVMELRKGAR